MRARTFAFAAMAAIAAIVAGFGIRWAIMGPPKPHQLAGYATIGGPFSLVDDTGTQVTQAALADKPSVIYFGYTFCPEVCPTTLDDLSRWIGALGAEADRLNYVFVTVDPERDTQKVMHDYVRSFDRHIRGFTGTPEQIAKIAKEYRVYYKRIPSKDGGYLMDHSAFLYLMGPNNKFVGTIAYQEDDASAIAKLRRLAGMIALGSRS